MLKIDKSVFSAEELRQYEALIAKAKVDPAAGGEEEPPLPPVKSKKEDAKEETVEEKELGKEKTETAKSMSPALAAALKRMEELEKSIRRKEISEVAKKYAPLGEDVEKLTDTLCQMYKSDQANYDAYIQVLDKSLALVEKSGVFAEIGKSGHGEGSAVGKVGAIAEEIMKSDPKLTREEAIAKAWIDHPELVYEYDKEYKG